MDKTVQEAVALRQLSAAGGPVDVYACTCVRLHTCTDKREREKRVAVHIQIMFLCVCI